MRSSHRSHVHELTKRLPASTVHKPIPTHKKVKHVGITVFRVAVCILIIYLGVNLLEHYGIFVHFGHTGDFVVGSVTDYLLVGSWEGEIPI